MEIYEGEEDLPYTPPFNVVMGLVPHYYSLFTNLKHVLSMTINATPIQDLTAWQQANGITPDILGHDELIAQLGLAGTDSKSFLATLDKDAIKRAKTTKNGHASVLCFVTLHTEKGDHVFDKPVFIYVNKEQLTAFAFGKMWLNISSYKTDDGVARTSLWFDGMSL